MNLLNEAERVVTCTHSKPEPYYVLTVPSGTSLEQLRALGVADDKAQFLADCLRDRQPMLAITDATSADCFHPATFPEVASLLAIEKASGETVRITIRRNGLALKIAALD